MGVTLRITSTSLTRVFNVWVSIIAWSSSAQYTVASNY